MNLFVRYNFIFIIIFPLRCLVCRGTPIVSHRALIHPFLFSLKPFMIQESALCPAFPTVAPRNAGPGDHPSLLLASGESRWVIATVMIVFLLDH